VARPASQVLDPNRPWEQENLMSRLLLTTLTPKAALLGFAAVALVSTTPAVNAVAAPTRPPSPTSSPSAKPPASKKATFGVEPASKGRPDGRVELDEGVTAGATFTEHVAFVNFSPRPFTFSVYATDAVNDNKGNLTLLPVGKQPTDAGSWLKIGGAGASGRVSVKPRGMVVLPVTGTVPTNAPPGDHVAGVVADLQTLGKRGNVNVLLHQRVGLRTFIRVAGDVHSALAVQDLTVKYANNWNPVGSGSAVVTYRVRNLGNVILSAKQAVTVDGMFGTTASAHPKTLPLLLPGGVVDVRVPLSGVKPEVWLSVKVHLTPAPISPSVDTAANVHRVTASTHFWAVPWTLIGIVVGLLAGGGAWWWTRRRRRRRVGEAKHAARKPKDSNRPVERKVEVVP